MNNGVDLYMKNNKFLPIINSWGWKTNAGLYKEKHSDDNNEIT
jgi:hypothetical protein